MNSLGSSPKWRPFDSIPSNSSFLHSESEQTEDETDAFSEGEVDSGITKPLSTDEGLSLSGLYLQLAHLYPPHLKSRSDQPSQWPDRTQQTPTATSPGASTFSSTTTVTPGDLIFAQKVSSFDWFSIFILRVWPDKHQISCWYKSHLSPCFLSVQVCIDLSVLWLTFYMDLRLGDLTKVSNMIFSSISYIQISNL